MIEITDNKFEAGNLTVEKVVRGERVSFNFYDTQDKAVKEKMNFSGDFFVQLDGADPERVAKNPHYKTLGVLLSEWLLKHSR